MRKGTRRHAVKSLLLALAALWGAAAGACTTAVISGSATADGRPVLWKNRDSDHRLNQVVHCADGKYAFVGLANRGDAAGMEIWAGVNAAGFAIMNSASYNLEREDTEGEGRFMRMALQSCATVDDFQALLEKTGSGNRDTSANFGVIDARGGAAVFESGRKVHRRFDASDPVQAPGGVLLRTNYSASGDAAAGTGFWRMRRARRLTEELSQRGRLDAGGVLATLARDLGNDALGTGPTPVGGGWAYTGDSICRYDTVAAVVIAGVRPGEDPMLSTFWVIPGQPRVGVAVPVWVASGAVPEPLLGGEEPAPMARACEALCEKLYPDRRGDRARYVDSGALAGTVGPVLVGLARREERNLERVREALGTWAKVRPGAGEMRDLQRELAEGALAALVAGAVEGGGEGRPAQKPGAGTPSKGEGTRQAAPRSGCGG